MFLYDMNENLAGSFENCIVYAISSYKGHYPTFKIKLESGALFDYIPPDALIVDPTSDRKQSLSLKELVYDKHCPCYNVSVNVFSFLSTQPLYCYFPTSKSWYKVRTYICSIDWYEENHSSHLVVLENGQICFVPNHKLLIKREQDKFEFQPYKKLRKEWK